MMPGLCRTLANYIVFGTYIDGIILGAYLRRYTEFLWKFVTSQLLGDLLNRNLVVEEPVGRRAD